MKYIYMAAVLAATMQMVYSEIDEKSQCVIVYVDVNYSEPNASADYGNEGNPPLSPDLSDSAPSSPPNADVPSIPSPSYGATPQQDGNIAVSPPSSEEDNKVKQDKSYGSQPSPKPEMPVNQPAPDAESPQKEDKVQRVDNKPQTYDSKAPDKPKVTQPKLSPDANSIYAPAYDNGSENMAKVGELSPTLVQYKDDYNAGIEAVVKNPADQEYAKALFYGAAGLETSFGINMPNASEQDRRGKYKEDSQEFGPTRMNKKLLRDLGYTDTQMELINSCSHEGNRLAAEAFAKGMETYGRDGFMSYQRGGITAYEIWKGNQVVTEDVQRLARDYYSCQKLVLKNQMTEPANKEFAFMYVPTAHEI